MMNEECNSENIHNLCDEIRSMRYYNDPDFLYFAEMGKFTVLQVISKPIYMTSKQFTKLTKALRFYQGKRGLTPKIKPFKVVGNLVYIKCYFCGKIHTHGACGGSGYGGTRVAHCQGGLFLNYDIVEVKQ